MTARYRLKRNVYDEHEKRWVRTDNDVSTDYPALISEEGDELISEDGSDLIPEDAAF